MLPPAAPASVVAVLLFTDLLDSTKWKERIGDRDYTAHLRVPHDRLFREVLAAFPGAVERDNAGDGFLVTFRTPSDAARFAVRLHRALAAHPWHDAVVRSGHSPATRVGIHQGEVVEFDDPSGPKVSGQAVDLAARVMGLAGGGRTLLTRHAFDSARQHTFDEPLGWTAHGRYRFKGKDDDPLEVFEVGEPDHSPPPPPDGEKAKRVLIDPADDTGAWRPAVGLAVPRRDGWALEAALGEGGFGEVWLARHKRTKEPRVFKFCFDADRLRSFKRELTFFKLIQSEFGTRPDFAKLLDVQVEKPPYSLESEHVPAGNLGQWVDGRGGLGGWPLADRIRFLAAVARAVAAAHSLGIIHKDLKPSNVLVREEGDTPQPVLADFGIGVLSDRSALAKGNVTETGFTESVMLGNDSSRTGTRLYSPPEAQAGKPATTGTDVYALGVMLFQFVAEDLHRPLGTGWADAIRTGDPDRDTLLTDDITAATFADPARRLSTAAAFADRLERLDARMAERKEQAARAEREKKATEQAKKLRTARRVAIAAAVATVALGALASFAWVQRNEAEAARKDEAKARGEAEAAERKTKASEAKTKEEEAKTQRTLAQALLGPIQDSRSPLTNFEEDALWQLAFLRNGPVPFMTLEQAVLTPESAKQLAAKADFLFHAVIGLNRDRAKVNELIATRLRDARVTAEHKTDLALAVVAAQQWGESTEAVVDVLVHPLLVSDDPIEWRRLTPALMLACEHLTAERQAEVCGRVADAMLARLDKTPGWYSLFGSAFTLAAVIGKLPLESADRVGGRVADTLLKALPVVVSELEQGGVAWVLVEVVMRSPPTPGRWQITTTDAIANFLNVNPNVYDRSKLAEHLGVLANRLPADRAAELLAQAVLRAKGNEERGRLATALASAAVRLSQSSAEKVCGPAADALAVELSKAKIGQEQRSLAAGLTALADRLPSERAGEMMAKTADGLAEAVVKGTNLLDTSAAAEALAMTTRFLPQERAAEVCGRAANALDAARTKAADALSLKLLAVGLVAVAGKLPAEKQAELGGRVADLLIAGMKRALHYDVEPYAKGLAAITVLLAPQQSERLLETAIDLVNQGAQDPKKGWQHIAASALAELAERVPASRVELVTASLIDGMGVVRNEPAWERLASGLAAVTSGLNAHERTCIRYATLLATLTGVVTLHPAALPKPRPLPPQQLVELLKHPFCVKEARRAVLDALEFTYDRKFADLWEFVAFAETEHPELDLLTPPKRPERVVPKGGKK